MYEEKLIILVQGHECCVIYSTQFQEVVIRSIPISDAVASVNGRGTAWYV
jgi:hypothetical protein